MTPQSRYAVEMARDYLERAVAILESDHGDRNMAVQILRSGDKQLELALEQPNVEVRGGTSPWTALGIGIGIGLGFLVERILRH